MRFSNSVIPVIEPTRIGGEIEQKANLERKLPTHVHEIEKKDGIIGQALFRAEKAFQSMPSSKSQVLILITDNKAEFTKKQWDLFLKNSSNRKSFVLINHQDRSIFVSNGQKRSHDNLLTAFLYTVNGIDGYQLYEQKKILSKQHIFLHDPKIENLEFQFTSSQKGKSGIKLKDSRGNHIFPYFNTGYCVSYWVPQPALGHWQVSVGNHNQVELLVFKKEKPDMSIGRLEFDPPPLSYEPGREMDLQIRLTEGKYPLNQIYGKVIWSELEEKIIFHQTANQALYIAKYAPKEAGKHKFIIDPNRNYIINPPIRTVELRMYQFPVWFTVSIVSGGTGLGGMILLLFTFLRRRSTRNEVKNNETEDEIGIDQRAEITELHNIIIKQKESGTFYQQEEQPEVILDAVEDQQDAEDSNTESIEQIPAIHSQDGSATLPGETTERDVTAEAPESIGTEDAIVSEGTASETTEDEGIDWYIGKFLSDIQGIVAADNTETNVITTNIVGTVSKEEDLVEEDITQGVDEKKLGEFDQGSDVDQRIDRILSEIELLSEK